VAVSADFDPEQYWSERLEETYSLAGVGFLGMGEEYNRWTYAVRRQAFRRTLRRRVGPGARVLDVGSGTGFYIDRWRELGVTDVTGSDLTGFAVERLRERYPENSFHKLDITSASPPDLGSFDAVSAMDMLFHIVDDESYARAIRNLAGLLAPRGLLVLTEIFAHRDTRYVRHEVDRSLEEIGGLLEGAGLVIESRRPLFVLMNTPIDSDSRLLEKAWAGVKLLVRLGPRSANLVGALLFPLEVALTRLLREGPSTEIVVCRKPAAPSMMEPTRSTT
jgi:SAM-dependent methyltransferase